MKQLLFLILISWVLLVTSSSGWCPGSFQLMLNEIKFYLTDIPSDFLDGPKDITTTPASITTHKSTEKFAKKIHKVDVNRTETVNDDKAAKFRTTTLDPSTSTDNELTSSTTETSTTFKPTPKIITTTSADPVEPTTEALKTTTESVKTSTSKSADVVPDPGFKHRLLAWTLGKLHSRH